MIVPGISGTFQGHVAQSRYHDIKVAQELGNAVCSRQNQSALQAIKVIANRPYEPAQISAVR